jgi:dTDP-glucose pyrophosphorylase
MRPLIRQNVRIIQPLAQNRFLSTEQWIQIREMWEEHDNKLVVAGQYTYQAELIKVIRQIQTELEVPVVGDVIS